MYQPDSRGCFAECRRSNRAVVAPPDETVTNLVSREDHLSRARASLSLRAGGSGRGGSSGEPKERHQPLTGRSNYIPAPPASRLVPSVKAQGAVTRTTVRIQEMVSRYAAAFIRPSTSPESASLTLNIHPLRRVLVDESGAGQCLVHLHDLTTNRA